MITMRQHRRSVDLRSRIERLAVGIEDFSTVRAALDGELRRAVDHQVAAISTLDPATMCWTSCFVSGVHHDAGFERVVYEHEFLADETNSYASLARADRPVGRLAAATDGDLRKVGRYRDLLAPIGATDEMRAVLRSHGACWGTITLYRIDPHPPFDEEDERILLDTAPAIADLFRLAMLGAAALAPSSVDHPPGLITVTATGEVRQSTAEASAWLAMLDDRQRVPAVITSLAMAATGGVGLPRAVLPTRQGRWVTLHASGLGSPEAAADEGDPSIAIIIEGTRPITLSRLVADVYGLTPREREVTSLVTAGLANKEIGRRLGISRYTAEDHVRSVLAKTSTSNRGSLVALLQGEHYQPRNEANHHPGPYGWYLDDSVRVGP
jgi:DNA-binding CsgD family transcriptional regulator